MPKAFVFLLVFLISLPASAQEYDRSHMPDRTAILANINQLREAPLSKKAKEAADQIMVFAHLEDKVFVSLKPRYIPWIRGNLPEIVEDKLLAAFIGGNIEYQLNAGVTENRAYEGVLMMLTVYEKMHAAGACPEIKRMELYRQWLSDGSLKTRLN